MSLVPDLEIGVWNAWIFIIILYVAILAPMAIMGDVIEKRTQGEPSGDEQSKKAKYVMIITHMIIMPLTLIISIFVPIKVGTWWLYSGLLVYVLGLVMVLMFSISFGTAPLGQPLEKGIFAVSRHPSYMGFFLAYLGTGIASASWILLLCALVWIISWQIGVVEEERILLEKYGEAYQRYLNRTPKWIGFPKK